MIHALSTLVHRPRSSDSFTNGSLMTTCMPIVFEWRSLYGWAIPTPTKHSRSASGTSPCGSFRVADTRTLAFVICHRRVALPKPSGPDGYVFGMRGTNHVSDMGSKADGTSINTPPCPEICPRFSMLALHSPVVVALHFMLWDGQAAA